MKLTTLIAVVLRLFAMYWAVVCVSGLLSTLGMLSMYPDNASNYLQYVIAGVLPVFYGTMAFVAWIFARAISLRVAGPVDPPLDFSQVTAENLYTLGILGIGLYFALSHLGGTATEIYRMILTRSGSTLTHQDSAEMLSLASAQLIPCLAGVGIAILSPKLGRKVAIAGSQSRPGN